MNVLLYYLFIDVIFVLIKSRFVDKMYYFSLTHKPKPKDLN